MRVPESKNVLDNTGVHPESYDAAKKLLEICSVSAKDISNGNTDKLKEAVEKLGEENLAKQLEVGIPTLHDIIKELSQPGRDPRE